MENVKKESGFRVPYPVLIVVTTIMLALVARDIARAASDAAVAKQVEITVKDVNVEIKPEIQKLKDSKADKADLDRVYIELKDIKDLLIKHMDKK